MIDPEAAEVIKRIFALYLAGNGTTRIARILNEECDLRRHSISGSMVLYGKGPRATKNEDLWGKATIYRMLTNLKLCRRYGTGRHKKGEL